MDITPTSFVYCFPRSQLFPSGSAKDINVCPSPFLLATHANFISCVVCGEKFPVDLPFSSYPLAIFCFFSPTCRNLIMSLLNFKPLLHCFFISLGIKFIPTADSWASWTISDWDNARHHLLTLSPYSLHFAFLNLHHLIYFFPFHYLSILYFPHGVLFYPIFTGCFPHHSDKCIHLKHLQFLSHVLVLEALPNPST